MMPVKTRKSMTHFDYFANTTQNFQNPPASSPRRLQPQVPKSPVPTLNLNFSLSRLDYHPEKGIYDLLISNASYDRDNGKFECKVKAGGSGANLHVQKYTLTVLTPPQEPLVTPGTTVTTTEGVPQELVCSSIGGSPDPQVKWYREGEFCMSKILINGKLAELFGKPEPRSRMQIQVWVNELR